MIFEHREHLRRAQACGKRETHRFARDDLNDTRAELIRRLQHREILTLDRALDVEGRQNRLLLGALVKRDAEFGINGEKEAACAANDGRVLLQSAAELLAHLHDSIQSGPSGFQTLGRDAHSRARQSRYRCRTSPESCRPRRDKAAHARASTAMRHRAGGSGTRRHKARRWRASDSMPSSKSACHLREPRTNQL